MDSLPWYENRINFKFDFMRYYISLILSLSMLILLFRVLIVIFIIEFFILLASVLFLVIIEIYIPFFFIVQRKLKFEFAFNDNELLIKDSSGSIETIKWQDIYKIKELERSGIVLWKAQPGMKTIVIRNDESVITHLKENYNRKMKLQLDKKIAKLRSK